MGINTFVVGVWMWVCGLYGFEPSREIEKNPSYQG